MPWLITCFGVTKLQNNNLVLACAGAAARPKAAAAAARTPARTKFFMGLPFRLVSIIRREFPPYVRRWMRIRQPNVDLTTIPVSRRQRLIRGRWPGILRRDGPDGAWPVPAPRRTCRPA
ncbi:MAG: hypothetical protein F4027_02370 [Rhodospirillaceae bacterium]|nr:hypothetical protein [Rhodospirillaceae bacterium]